MAQRIFFFNHVSYFESRSPSPYKNLTINTKKYSYLYLSHVSKWGCVNRNLVTPRNLVSPRWPPWVVSAPVNQLYLRFDQNLCDKHSFLHGYTQLKSDECVFRNERKEEQGF